MIANISKKTLVVVIAILSVLVVVLFFQKQSLYYSQKYEKAVPHIELGSAMSFYGVDMYNGAILRNGNPGDVAIGSITGFVRFPNSEDQPKDAWQYYSIVATDAHADGKQLFRLEETLKLPAIPPRRFDDEVLVITGNTDQVLTLESESGQTFRINKLTDEASVIDMDGDISTLITNDSEFRDFMLSFSK